jgi:hypothetical protein
VIEAWREKYWQIFDAMPSQAASSRVATLKEESADSKQGPLAHMLRPCRTRFPSLRRAAAVFFSVL